MIRWRRIKNELKGVYLYGNWCEEPSKVRDVVREFFENRFKATKSNSISLGNILFPSLIDEEKAINQCGSTKSPRPDGFNFYFIKNGLNTFLVLISVVFVADDPHFDRIFKMVLIFTECLK